MPAQADRTQGARRRNRQPAANAKSPSARREPDGGAGSQPRRSQVAQRKRKRSGSAPAQDASGPQGRGAQTQERSAQGVAEAKGAHDSIGSEPLIPSPGTPGEGKGGGSSTSSVQTFRSRDKSTPTPALPRSTGRGRQKAPPIAAFGEVKGLAFSNLDKVLYPQANFTKRDVIDYYLG